MELIRVTKENLAQEHICCAISKNDDCQVAAKKAWLAERFDEGLVFLKGNVRGKCFIEYIPAEAAWLPIEAAGYMVIDCLWVSGSQGAGQRGSFAGSLYPRQPGEGQKGAAVLSSEKKNHF